MSGAILTVAAGRAPWWRDPTQPRLDDFRACALCDHAARNAEHTLCCTHPDLLLLHGQPAPVTTARQRHGGCGPDALRMAAPWLKP